jgi:DNA-binding NtrC family response regulator
MSEKVLLVDDEEDFLEVMSERMQARGMEVETCTSAEQAIEKLKSEAFDAIILDFMMPGIDGMQALKDIKARSPEAQIILLTGHATVEKGVEAIKAGATDFLEKPADLEDLEKKIKDASTRRMLIVEKQAEDKLKDTLKRFGF